MAANWNLGQDFIEGASLGARIAGQKRQQAMEADRLATEKTRVGNEAYYQAGQLGLGESKQANETAELPSKIALNKAHEKELGQMGDYYSGKNAAYQAVGLARAQAAAGKVGQGQLAAVLKDYDDRSKIDHDGSRGIYTPQMALEHAALINRFNTANGIAGVAPVKGDDLRTAPAPGLFDRTVSGIAGAATSLGNFFGGGAPAPGGAPAAATPAPGAPAASGMIRVRNKQTGVTGSIPQANMNTALYEPLGQ